MLQPSGEAILKSDKRAPIIHLRPFIKDSLTEKLTRVKIGPLIFIPDPRVEDDIAGVLNCIGPFIALGKPGQRLPETGAYRLYVDSEHWEGTIIELYSVCRFVIVLGVADTKNVVWEIQQAMQRLRPDQIVFMFPYPYNYKQSEFSYQNFKRAVEDYFPHPFPDELGKRILLGFSADWKPRFIGDPGIGAPQRRAAFLSLVRRFEPDFREPPFWRVVPTPRLYLFAGVCVIWASLMIALIAWAIENFPS